jgi:hypothetical protein
MVFIRDEGSFFDATLEDVWKYLASGDAHSGAHHHRKVKRKALGENSGIYSWKQDFRGKAERFSMQWQTYYPVGIGYEVLEGPFELKILFDLYSEWGSNSSFDIGDFVSPEIAQKCLTDYITTFFDLEFQQDSEALQPRNKISK